jgi:GR25 family glycosyltransferase involved in LPS biosynthesis
MNLKNKLKDLPPIYLLTLDERPDRLEYAETQYEKWEITNYTKVSGSKYQVSNYEDWKNMIIINPISSESSLKQKFQHLTEIAISLSQLLIIKTWLETTNDPYMIIMEDDYNLSYIKYWHFDWNYLMNNIPHDWDCIQISFENGSIIPCFLHPIISGHGTGASLINREYAKKILRLYYVDDKFNFSKKINCVKWMKPNPNITVDYFLGHSGKTYCLPLFSVNPKIGSYAKNINRMEDRGDLTFTIMAYNKWWKKLRDTYTLEEFFTYGKYNDRIITRKEPDLESYV